MRSLAPLLLLFLASACADTAAAPLPVSENFVIVRLHVDPSTRLGELLASGPEGANLDMALDNLSCEAAIVLVIQIESAEGASNFGTARLLIGTAASGDICNDGGAVLIQPASWIDEENRVAIVEGPVLIEGEALDGRIPIGALGGLGASAVSNGFEVFPSWWRISGRARGLDRKRDPENTEDITVRITEASARSLWTVEQLRQEALTDISPLDDPELSLLDYFIRERTQPDVDVDGDGIERFEDTDGDDRIDRCIDGDGTILEGTECTADPRFADAYEIRLIFRTVPVEAR